jgi:hypothetical protein
MVFVGMLAFVLIGFMGCSTLSTYHQDPNVPWEEQALISLDSNSMVVGVDDDVSMLRAHAISQGQVGVIPAGTHILHVAVEIIEYSNTYRVGYPGIAVTYDFHPGGRYILSSSRSFGSNEVKIRIQTLDEHKAEWYAEMNATEGDGSLLDKVYQRNTLSVFKKAEEALSK